MEKILPGGGGIRDSGSNAEAPGDLVLRLLEPYPLLVNAPYCGRWRPNGQPNRLTPERLLHSGEDHIHHLPNNSQEQIM